MTDPRKKRKLYTHPEQDAHTPERPTTPLSRFQGVPTDEHTPRLPHRDPRLAGWNTGAEPVEPALGNWDPNPEMPAPRPMRGDFNSWLQSLPPEQQRTALQLMKEMSMTQARDVMQPEGPTVNADPSGRFSAFQSARAALKGLFK